ncbi:MAG: hypothetical protein H7250_03860 [Flavobacterium sp.]|nr:hypothetical protein [Flavobacterium sp.]
MKFKIINLLVLLVTILSFSQNKKSNKKLNFSNYENEKTFVAVEKNNMFFDNISKSYSNVETGNPKKKWFNKFRLRIIKDSVFLDKTTIIRNGKDEFSSESDGGFYYFRGILKKSKNEKLIELTEMECDYCPKLIVEKGVKPIEQKKIYGKITKNGIEIENIKFTEIEYYKLKLGSEYRKK